MLFLKRGPRRSRAFARLNDPAKGQPLRLQQKEVLERKGRRRVFLNDRTGRMFKSMQLL